MTPEVLPEVMVVETGDFARVAAAEIRRRLHVALTASPVAALALAGGETPQPVYRQLARAGEPGVDWDRVEFYWSDERLVPTGDPASNVTAARRALLGPLGILPARVHAPLEGGDRVHEDPEAVAAHYESTIRDSVAGDSSGVPRFDLVLLGVGTDGHTASLFPDTRPEPGRLVVSARSPTPPEARISFSYQLLAAAREVLFLVTGADKAQIARRSLEDRDPSLPATRVRAERMCWILDRSAANALSQ